ncbi:hypothetical protein HYFRA_00008151 [Hymenoscyphus fraxineus]|uniref:SMP-30/Gluconolactonase/LRE-like region domain-containing protein n=1 Tax=Hymenoscyphus fraxineus TaxID=746836 RepID=A0A9N9LBH9_9HELO|nr:hypothetical protein HYFRA_00008151 [Hymenoscyphus fraxineus]
MYLQSTLLASVLALTHFTNALALPASKEAAVRILHQFPNGTNAENIAVRSNGHIIVNMIAPAAQMYQIDPKKPAKAALVAEFPGSTSVLGIAEIEKDIFIVSVGSLAGVSPTPGSFSIWKVDFRSLESAEGNVTRKAITTKVTSMPEAVLNNGVTAVARNSPYVLVADSGLGRVWRVDTRTGEYKCIIEDPLMLPQPGNPLVIGINGLHVFGNTLYFTNTVLDGGFVAKVGIETSGPNAGAATGKAEIHSKNGSNDDFTLDKKGIIYSATNFRNSVERMDLNGTSTTIAGGQNETILEANTAVAFGRGKTDKEVLYVTTGGNVLPAKVVLVDLKAL